MAAKALATGGASSASGCAKGQLRSRFSRYAKSDSASRRGSSMRARFRRSAAAAMREATVMGKAYGKKRSSARGGAWRGKAARDRLTCERRSPSGEGGGDDGDDRTLRSYRHRPRAKSVFRNYG